MNSDYIIAALVLLGLLAFGAIMLLIYLGDRHHWWSRWWARWFPQRQGGTVLLVPIGTFGMREALRMATTFIAAGATRESLAVVLLDFHQEVYEYAEVFRKMLGKNRVITPRNMPPGSGQGFLHRMEHRRRTKEIWERELRRMIGQARQLNTANGSTVTTIWYILPSWSGHFPIAVEAVPQFKAAFPSPVLHFGRLNLPASNEPELVANMRQRPDYPACLQLDGVIISDQARDIDRQYDWPIAAGLTGLFAANRVDPGQQHGANPLHALALFAQGSGGYVTIGVGQKSTPLVPIFRGINPAIGQQDLSLDVGGAISESFKNKAWDTADPPEDVSQFVSVVVPLDPAHPEWRHPGLRRDAIRDLPDDSSLPIGCSIIWTYAAIDNGTKDTAPIFALWLYPVTTEAQVVAKSGRNGDVPQPEPQPAATS